MHVFDVPKGLYADSAALSFSPDGSRFAFSTSGKARLWELATGVVVQSWDLPPGLIDAFVYRSNHELFLFRVELQSGGTPDPTTLAPGTLIVRLRNLCGEDPGAPLAELPGYNHVFGSRAARGGRFFIFEGVHSEFGRAIRALDPGTGGEIFSLFSPSAESSALLTIDPSDEFLAAIVAVENRVDPLLIDVSDHRVVRRLSRNPAGLHQADGGLQLAVCNWPTGGLEIVVDDGGKAVTALGFRIHVTSTNIEFSRDGTRVFWGCANRTARVAELETLRERLRPLGLDW